MNINALAKDIEFSVKKHGGLLQFEDQGMADLHFSGQGISISTVLSPITTPTSTIIKALRSTCTVNSLELQVHETSVHSEWVYNNVAAPYVKRIIRNKIETAIVDWMQSFKFELPVSGLPSPSSQQ